MTPTMNESEIARRRDHLIAEIFAPEPAVNKVRILSSAAAVILIIALATGLLVNQTGGSSSASPRLLLASADHAVQSTTDVVLYARETHYNKDNPSQGQTASEGWVDRSTPGVGRVVSLDNQGKPLVDSSTSVQDGQTIRRDVSYSTSTVYMSPGAAVSVIPLLPSEAKSIVGDENVDGIDSTHLSGERNQAPIDTWIAKESKLPVRVATLTTNGLVVLDYQWLARTQQALDILQSPVPANFAKTDTPIPASQQPSSPGSSVVPVAVPGQTLSNVVATLPSAPTTTTIAGEPPRPTTTASPASPTTIGAAPTTTTPRPVVTTSSSTTSTSTTTSTTVGPTDLVYNRSTSAGTHGQTCQDTPFDNNVVVTACVGGVVANNGADNSGVGDVRVYKVINGVKYATTDYLVLARKITINQSNGVGGAYDCVNSCTATKDYASATTATVYHEDLRTVTVQVFMDYEVYLAAYHPSRPQATLTVSTPQYQVTGP